MWHGSQLFCRESKLDTLEHLCESCDGCCVLPFARSGIYAAWLAKMAPELSAT